MCAAIKVRKSAYAESYFDDGAGDDLIEAPLKGDELFSDMFVENVVSVEQAIILLVIVVNFNRTTILYQLFNYNFSELFQENVEVEFHLIDRFSCA